MSRPLRRVVLVRVGALLFNTTPRAALTASHDERFRDAARLPQADLTEREGRRACNGCLFSLLTTIVTPISSATGDAVSCLLSFGRLSIGVVLFRLVPGRS